MVTRHLAVIAAALLAVVPARSQTASVLVFGAESNRLNAYDGLGGTPAAKQTVIPSASDDPLNGRDINAQVCFFPDGSRRFVAGEDTGQPNPPPGWGIFQLAGSTIGALSATQIGKLTPTYQPITDPSAQEDNYGCGFLSDGRIVTTDIGNILPGFDGNGQLIIWFPPYDSFTVRYCKLDLSIATAAGIYVDAQDRIYVASNRPDTLPPVTNPGGIFRFSPPYPTSDDAAGGCGLVDATGAPLATTVNKQVFILADAFATTPSAIVGSHSGTFYVSSVFTGTIAEYDANGLFVRTILQPPVGETLPYSTGTPYGIAIDTAGTLYYADLGVGVGPPPGPVDGEGSEFRLRFQDGQPLASEMLDDGLLYPDGIGILEIPLGSTTTTVLGTSTTTSTTQPGALNLTQASLRTSSGVPNGGILVKGDFLTPPAFSFPPGFTVRVRDSLALDRSHTFSNCRSRPNGGVRCSDPTASGRVQASFTRFRTGGVYRFRVSFMRETVTGPFSGPVTMTLLHNAGATRTDTISDCRQTGRGLGCREG
jgi:hypothetical protein